MKIQCRCTLSLLSTCTTNLPRKKRSSIQKCMYVQGCIQDFFYGGGTHISAPTRGFGGMLPQKIFCIQRWTLTKFWGGGGGGKLKLEGGNPSAPPPLYATLMYYVWSSMVQLTYNVHLECSAYHRTRQAAMSLAPFSACE